MFYPTLICSEEFHQNSLRVVESLTRTPTPSALSSSYRHVHQVQVIQEVQVQQEDRRIVVVFGVSAGRELPETVPHRERGHLREVHGYPIPGRVDAL